MEKLALSMIGMNLFEVVSISFLGVVKYSWEIVYSFVLFFSQVVIKFHHGA